MLLVLEALERRNDIEVLLLCGVRRSRQSLIDCCSSWIVRDLNRSINYRSIYLSRLSHTAALHWRS